jgi:transcriptional regulator with XRE-family HTH domain
MGISQYRLAKNISVPPRRINEIVHGKRSIPADTALRLGRFLECHLSFGYERELRALEEAEPSSLHGQGESSGRVSEQGYRAMSLRLPAYVWLLEVPGERISDVLETCERVSLGKKKLRRPPCHIRYFYISNLGG